MVLFVCDQTGSRIAVKPGKTEARLALAIASVTVALGAQELICEAFAIFLFS